MIEFSRAKIEDADEFIEMKIDAFSDDVEKYGFGPPEYNDKQNFLKSIAINPIYKITKNGKIIGGMSCKINDNNHMWLSGIYIKKSHQGRGIGTSAIDFLENEFPQTKTWRLHTPYLNFRNHYFYEKLGYVKVGETEPKSGEFYLFEYRKKMKIP